MNHHPGIASSVLMVRPAAFGYNPETAASNAFQSEPGDHAATASQALVEFDAMVATLRENRVHVTVVQDTPSPPKPDAVFPNNWFSTHPDGRVILYPMASVNRREERRTEVFEALHADFVITSLGTSGNIPEATESYLEGTGSIVFDHTNRLAYACRSSRTDEGLLKPLCATLHFTPVVFDALDASGKPVYHTNVVMAMGTDFAVVCLESIAGDSERAQVAAQIEASGKQVLAISREQMGQFAGNMLAVANAAGEVLLCMSQTAHDALTAAQREFLRARVQLLPIAIPTIETVGGGSVRCMLAEIFLPRR